MTINLRGLHNLYQSISPASFLENEHALVGISQLERSKITGEIEWVIGIGAKGEEKDTWWSTRLDSGKIEELMIRQLQGKAVTKDNLVSKIRASWIEGRLDVKGLEEAQRATERLPIELVIWLEDNIPLSISLSPCDGSPLPLLSIVTHLIPPYLTGSTAQATLDTLEPQLTAAQREVNTLSADNAFLRNEVKELQKRLREGGGGGAGGRLGKRGKTEEESNTQSQGGHASQSGSQAMRGGSASLSPQKKGRPGIDYKAVMRPGTKGYAGSMNRVGRNLDDEWEEPGSDSD